MAARLKWSGLPSFRNGVHPPEHKDLTSGIASRRLPFPDEIILPLSQHIGRPAEALVKPGDRVERGDVIVRVNGKPLVKGLNEFRARVRAVKPRQVLSLLVKRGNRTLFLTFTR